MVRHKLALLILLISSPMSALAGVMEVGYMYSQSESRFDDDNFSETISHTGSFAWYFFELSALQISYTRGEAIISGKAASDTEGPIKYRVDARMYGADLVFTLAQKDWSFQPYVKGGAVWVDKKIYRKSTTISEETLIAKTDKDDAVPSMGVGFKLLLTKTIRLKASYERWRSGKNSTGEQWDSAVRGGVSFFF